MNRHMPPRHRLIQAFVLAPRDGVLLSLPRIEVVAVPSKMDGQLCSDNELAHASFRRAFARASAQSWQVSLPWLGIAGTIHA